MDGGPFDAEGAHRGAHSAPARRAFADLHDTNAEDRPFAALRRSELICRPLGDDAFLDAISQRLNRVVTPRKRGRNPKGDLAGAETKGAPRRS